MRSGYFKVDYYHDREILPFTVDRLTIALVSIFLVSLPVWASPYLLHLMNLAGIAVIGAVGLNILMGYTGQISLGHAAFLAIGGYTTAILLTNFPTIPWPLIVVVSGLVSALVGVVAALPAFRLKGLYLALSTLAFYEIVMFIILKAKPWTNGAEGLNVPRPTLFGGMTIYSTVAFYVTIMGLAILGVIVCKNLLRTKTGRAFIAIRDWDLAASAVGVNLRQYKTLAFMISSFYTGVAGSLYAYYLGFISPDDFTMLVSINYIGMVLVGGMGTLVGAVTGAVFMTFLPEFASMAAGYLGTIVPAFGDAGVVPYFERLIFGVVIVLFLIFEPDGIYGWLRNLRKYLVMWPFRY
ncbi:MAG: branched-chain amino acid ABC transporter permease [Thermincola sp.]|jgi:branched-chain amino acid transport system permease protein|nr:branched-chain amino acid ABC transporter permease [Thermincola sp.]MDT3704992.1 branched-chain amino acid ABC transporter permease [Thermincola sp.]